MYSRKTVKTATAVRKRFTGELRESKEAYTQRQGRFSRGTTGEIWCTNIPEIWSSGLSVTNPRLDID
jgi:hypothetical protein